MSQHTPLSRHHDGAGAQLESLEGAFVPVAFGDWTEEYDALRQHAGVLDLSFRSLLVLRGNGAANFLNNMVTNEVGTLRRGGGCNALKVSLQGKVEAALRVLRSEDALWCELEPGPCEALFDALRKRIILADVRIENESDGWALVSVQGPRAADALAALDVDVGALDAPHAHDEATLAGEAVRVVRSDHTGEGGYDVFVSSDAAIRVWEALLAGDDRLRPVGLTALNARRIEAGIPWHRSELADPRLPQEAGLDAGWISYTKGCYLGQETVARLHHLGHVNRHLRGVVLEGEAPVETGTTLRAAGKDVGVITSIGYSPRRQRSVGLAYIRRQHAEPGIRLELSSGSSSFHAEVTPLPMP